MKELTQQELIRVFSAYLPYELKVISEDGQKELVSVHSDDLVIGLTGCLDTQFYDLTCKPILWDLSMLTKEIEHDGRKFIPMHMLKNGGTDLNEYRFLEWKGYSVIDNEEHETCYCPKTMSFYQFYRGDSRMCTNQYEKFQLLLKWHFNIFGLDESQYINKATLKK